MISADRCICHRCKRLVRVRRNTDTFVRHTKGAGSVGICRSSGTRPTRSVPETAACRLAPSLWQRPSFFVPAPGVVVLSRGGGTRHVTFNSDRPADAWRRVLTYLRAEAKRREKQAARRAP